MNSAIAQARAKHPFRMAAAISTSAMIWLAVTTERALATTTAAAPGGAAAALPWEGALGTLANGLTGPTAKIIAVIAIFVAGIALIFGEDLGQFARRLLMIVIAVAFLIGAGSFINTFVGGSAF